MNKKFRLLILLLFSSLFVALFTLSASAEGYHSVFPKAESDAEKTLITAEPITLRKDGEAYGVRALYTVDKEALATLERTYNVTFGALVGRASDGYDLSTMKLTYNGNLWKPKHTAMLTVYSTDEKREVTGKFLTEAEDAFAVTLDIGVGTAERTCDGAVHLAFILLEDKKGERDARILYVGRKGTSYGSVPTVQGIVEADYQKNKKGEDAMKEYIAFQQAQVQNSVSALENMRVMVCGDGEMASTLPAGERAIWVEYLPDKDPYATSRETAKRNVRAAYIYYPLDFDPSFETAAELSKLGVRRVFAYISTPPYAENVPGLVCVHGGGGHAYAEYALEASMHGFAAIAIDTEGCYNMTGGEGTPYSAADTSYKQDPLGHGGKDSFKNAEGALTEQWLYNAVMDTALANTVLRALPEVNADAVGITGISWGGLITSTALCYDHRYAFAVPIYISFHMAESYGISVGGLKTKPFAAALWQDTELLKKCPVPTLIISCENDLFASVDTVSKSANDLPNGRLLIKPRLLHGQQHGASLPEIYHFAYTVLGEARGFINPKTPPTAEMDVSYTLELNIPRGATRVSAKLYYLTEPQREYDSRDDVYFEEKALTVTEDGKVAVEIPPETRLYFISFSYYDAEVDRRQSGTPYLASDKYERGFVYSSTDLVTLN